MRTFVLILMAALAGAALVVANPDNQVGNLLQKSGLLDGMIARYTVMPGAGAVPEKASPPAPPDPMIARLTGLIEILRKENNEINLKIRAIEAKEAKSNMTSGDLKRYERDIADNEQRIADYQDQLSSVIAHDKTRQ